MADKKISALTAATTPLAGTEVLPIVQGGATVKVSVDNLTTGKPVSMSNLTYTGTLTGGTGVVNIGSGQVYKDASGNVGIGVTPSAWTTSVKAIQFGSNGSLVNRTGGSGTYLSSNAYFSGDPSNTAANGIYINSTLASSYLQTGGTHVWFTAPSGTAGNAISFTQAMTLDASGNVGIGTSSPGAKLEVSGDTTNIFLRSTTTGSAALRYYVNGTEAAVARGLNGGIYAIETLGSERLRIGADGFASLFVTANDGFSSRNSVAAGTSNALYLGYHSATGTTNGTLCYVVWSNGDVVNTNNSYGAYSDIKLKENIVPASPKLDKLMQVEIVNYNLKDQPEHKLLGVVAQQLEQVFPSLVEESPDRDEEGNDLGTVTKSVKYSVFVPMLIKAMQEQQALITQLQADVAALKAK
jgi:hypothetical protein